MSSNVHLSQLEFVRADAPAVHSSLRPIFGRSDRAPDAARATSLAEMFEIEADRSPEAIALECGDRRLTYRELDAEANRLAHALRALGIGRGTRVGIALDRSEWPIIAVLAVLKSGAAYVAIEPSLPDERIRYIADAGALKVILTNGRYSDRMALLASSEILPLERYQATKSAHASRRLSKYETGSEPNDECYVLFTSGTTGKPKGVVTEHRNVVHFVGAFNEVCETTSEDRVFQGFSLAFDGSVEEMWMAFSNGATLVCGAADTPRFGEDLWAFLDEKRISFLSTVPTLLSTIPRDIPSLRQLIVSGEACHPDLVARWDRSGLTILNVYGPTEATVNTTAARLKRGQPVTIGRPLAGYDIHILDEALKPVPYGEKGELFVAGPGLARGYLNAPDLTGQAFIHWTAPSVAGRRDDAPGEVRLYRTGDEVRWNDAGELEFFGRKDGQVKLRGFRIELGEIEELLVAQPGISAAAVRVYEKDDLACLAAYVLLDRDGDVDRAALGRVLREHLPVYMVPQFLDVVTVFPRLTSGKIDRKSLPEPVMPLSGLASEGAEPMSRAETDVAEIWAAEFGVPAVGAEQNFFTDLGGHSLLAARVANAMRAKLGLQVPVRDIYRHPTVRDLTRHTSQTTPPAEAGRAPPRIASRGAMWTRALLTIPVQILYLLSIGPILALPMVLVLPLAVDALSGQASALQLAAVGVGVVLGTWLALVVTAVLAKWVLIGRFKPGRYPLWGSFYVRWWLASRLQHLSHITIFNGTPLMPVLWRLMGAKIGKSCFLNPSLVYAWDCIAVGDDVSIGADTQLPALRIEDGFVVVGRIEIGDRCHIGSHSMIGLDVKMEDDAKLGDQSLLADGCTLAAGQSYRGSPARPMPIALPPGDPIRHGPLRLAAFAALQTILGFVVTTLALAPLMVGAWATARIVVATSWTVWLPAFLLIVPAVLFVFAFWSGLCLAFIYPNPRPGIVRIYSARYLAHWLSDRVMQVVKVVGRPVFTTVYLPPWMRLLGARLGRHTEMSTVWTIDPAFLSAGDSAFFADGCMMPAMRVHLGQMQVGRTHVGDRAFLGNSAILPPGSRLGNDCLLGVLSSPPDDMAPIPDGTDWLGSPAFQLPNRQKATCFASDVTFEPTAWLYLQRALIDGLRVLLPGYVLGAIGIGALLAFLAAYGTEGAWGAYAMVPFLIWGALVTCIGTVVGFKWAIMGRFKPVVMPLWCRYVWWNELINGLYESLMTPIISHFFGTPFAPLLLRMLGCKVGKSCYVETTLVSEFDLVEIGDYVALNAGVVIQNHLFEDRVFKSAPLRISKGATVGNMSVVLYDTVMEERALLGPLSLLMKGEVMAPESHWHGSPTVSVERT